MPQIHEENLKLPVKIHSASIILKNLNKNKLILSKRTKDFMPAICTGKIVAALVALESGKTQLLIEIPDNIVSGISRVSLYDLIRIMMNTHNKEIADIIAENTYGSVEEFVVAMNEIVRKIRAYSTQFTNPLGLNEENYTTAEDCVKIMEYALRNFHFRKIAKCASFSIENDENKKIISSPNQIVRKNSELYIPECIGAKYAVQGAFSNHIALFKKDSDVYLLILLGIRDTDKENLRFKEVKNIMDCIL
jgi:D-alanyl-D-alanine carboxypeptidase